MPGNQDDDKGESIFAAVCQEQLMAPFTVEGSCNRVVFEIWWETCLIHELKPGQVVVMDNATLDQGGRIEQLIQEAGCELLYLPAYSPDFNKIERCWSGPGSRIRKQLEQLECLGDAMEYVLHKGVLTALAAAISPERKSVSSWWSP